MKLRKYLRDWVSIFPRGIKNYLKGNIPGIQAMQQDNDPSYSF
tara:strand:- start:458 stop:586 length:129 start_codon:yes stop_codon:yes gene_type:complete